MKFKVEVIDVWEMTITAVEGEFVTKKKAWYHFADEQGRSVPLPGRRELRCECSASAEKAAEPETAKAVAAY